MRAHQLVPALLLALAACRGGGNDRPGAMTSTTYGSAAPIVRACPLGLPGTRVILTEEADRIVVAFTTTPDRVLLLRGRLVSHAAGGPDRHEGPGHDGLHGGSHAHGLRLWDLQPMRTIIEETPDGASLHVMPLAREDMAELAATLAEHVRALEEKDCP